MHLRLLPMKYAYVRDGIVQSVFDTDRPAADFPDIEPWLVECGKEVECNWAFDGKTFAPVTVPKEQYVAQIEALEASQARALREAVLTGDKVRLQQIDDEIAALREAMNNGK